MFSLLSHDMCMDFDNLSEKGTYLRIYTVINVISVLSLITTSNKSWDPYLTIVIARCLAEYLWISRV